MQLTDRVRAGSLPDYGYLFEKYRYQALHYAHSLVSQPADADELVAIAFEKVLDIMRRGLGPDDDGFWSYLVVTLRHCAWSLERERKCERLDDHDFLEQVASSDELAAVADEQFVNGYETALIRAFKRLPSNYRLVLLLAEVERQPLIHIAPLFKLSANAVGALAYRARGRLRELYQQELSTSLPTR